MSQLSLKSIQGNSPEATSPSVGHSNTSLFFKPFIQPKLSINQPDDVFEHQANEIAGEIINSPANDNSFFKPSVNKIQKKHDSGTPNEEANGNLNYDFTGGKPIENKIKNFMEPRFGYDFGDVKTHNDTAAHQSAASINALAYTYGSNIVFGKEQYQPDTNQGRHLIAHELTHIVQQSEKSLGLNIQRTQTDLVTGTKGTNSAYDLDNDSSSPRQIKSLTRTTAFPEAKLAYDEGGSTFTITFTLTWIFPHGWDDSKRDAFVAAFEASVKNAWNDRYLLQESGGKHRSAHVNLNFDENVVHQMKDEYDEAIALSKILQSKLTWLMDTRDPFVRDNVSGSTVQLDQDANKDQKRKGSSIASGAGFVIHDGNENKIFTQNTSAHEFGHMIGLADEYLNDSGTAPSQISAARGHINDRIMNVGDKVTSDVYAPFADWLSALTKVTWTVGGKVR